MAQIDVSSIANDTAQLNALNQLIASTTDASVKAMLMAQASMLSNKIQAEATHAQAQVDATNNFMDNMALWQTLSGVFGGISANIPTIVNIFKK